MSVEAIKNIKEVEERAQQLLKDTKATAKKMVSDASEEAERIAQESDVLVDKKIAAMLLEAQNSAQQEFDRILAQTSQECDALKKEAQNQVSRAADIIFGRIVKANGNR